MVFECESQLELRVHPNVHSMSGEKVIIVNLNIFSCWFFNFCQQCISPIKSFKELFHSGFSVILRIEVFISFNFSNSLRIGVWSSVFQGFSSVRKQISLFRCPGLFVPRSSFRQVVRSRSSSGFVLRIAMPSGLINLDCSGLTTENSSIRVFVFIKRGDSVVLVTLTAAFLSLIVDKEWEINKLAVPSKLSKRVTVPVVLNSDGWSTKGLTNFVVLGGIFRVSSVRTDWGFEPILIAPLLTCFVKCGKCKKPCVISMTALLCLMNCNPTIGTVKLLVSTKCSAKVLSQTSNLSVVVANSSSKWPFPTCNWTLGGSSVLKRLFGACGFVLSNSI